MKVIVYGDFNSLYCYVASQRADQLVREGKADVEWCAVEHRPRLPVTGVKPPPGSVGAHDDLAGASRLAPGQGRTDISHSSGVSRDSCPRKTGPLRNHSQPIPRFPTESS